VKKGNNTPNYRNYLKLKSFLNAQKLISKVRGKKICAGGSVGELYLKKSFD